MRGRGGRPGWRRTNESAQELLRGAGGTDPDLEARDSIPLVTKKATPDAAHSSVADGDSKPATDKSQPAAAAESAAGNILHHQGHDRVDELDEVARRTPVTLFAFGLAGVSLIYAGYGTLDMTALARSVEPVEVMSTIMSAWPAAGAPSVAPRLSMMR